jgi:malate dehydrogenase (oxaloacetate-decarboxylating)(NADP+)
VDSKGVINNQRENLTKEKLDYVSTTHKQTLADAMYTAAIFISILMVLALASSAPLKIKGKPKTLFT